MKKTSYLLLLLALLLTVSSCGGGEKTYLYKGGEHTHIYGSWYDVEPVTCMKEGRQIRYCKICHAAEERIVPVPEEIEKRAHLYECTVVPPTEYEWGYTTKRCTLCQYVIEKTDPVPPLYALLEDEHTVKTPPAGLDGAVMASASHHILSHSGGKEKRTDGTVAFRLAVLLTVEESLADEKGSLDEGRTVTIREGLFAGRTYTLGQLLRAFAKTGDPNVLYGFSGMLEESGSAFLARVENRMVQLGLGAEMECSPTASTATLYATAVLMGRILDAPAALSALSATVPEMAQVAGTVPLIFLQNGEGTVRGTAVKGKDGIRFLVLAGETLALDAEDAFYL